MMSDDDGPMKKKLKAFIGLCSEACTNGDLADMMIETAEVLKTQRKCAAPAPMPYAHMPTCPSDMCSSLARRYVAQMLDNRLKLNAGAEFIEEMKEKQKEESAKNKAKASTVDALLAGASKKSPGAASKRRKR